MVTARSKSLCGLKPSIMQQYCTTYNTIGSLNIVNRTSHNMLQRIKPTNHTLAGVAGVESSSRDASCVAIGTRHNGQSNKKTMANTRLAPSGMRMRHKCFSSTNHKNLQDHHHHAIKCSTLNCIEATKQSLFEATRYKFYIGTRRT